MTDKKLTDSEIVKALECCSEENKCKQCPYYNKGNFKCLNYKFFKDLLDLINRLQAKVEFYKKNRDKYQDDVMYLSKQCDELQAENETLKGENIALNRRAMPSSGHILKVGNALLFAENKEDYDITINAIKAEAYKEFAERLKRKACMHNHKECSFPDIKVVCLWDIDRLLEEMVGEDNA